MKPADALEFYRQYVEMDRRRRIERLYELLRALNKKQK
jgi:hypothetical protein